MKRLEGLNWLSDSFCINSLPHSFNKYTWEPRTVLLGTKNLSKVFVHKNAIFLSWKKYTVKKNIHNKKISYNNMKCTIGDDKIKKDNVIKND